MGRAAGKVMRPNRTLARSGLLFSLALICVAAAFVGNRAASVPALGSTADAPPNLVLVLVDDLGLGELQWYPELEDLRGAEPNSLDAIQTPHLFSLAQQGLRFTRFYANGPVCSPTRAAILTGRYPQAFGLRRVYPYGSGRGLPDVPTIATLLSKQGYHTGHFGKWHLGESAAEYLPVNRGFDESLMLSVPDGEGYRDCDWIRGDDLAHPTRDGGRHSAETITNAALAFVAARHREELAQGSAPYFLNVWYRSPHVPLDPPALFLGPPQRIAPKSAWEQDWKSLVAATPGLLDHGYHAHDLDAQAKERALYAASVSYLDAQIGRLLAGIDALYEAERTLVVFTSDNGPDLKFYARTQGGFPPGWQPKGTLRAGKGSVYEGGIRVPMFVRWPGHVAAGGTNASLSATFDFLPTLHALAGGGAQELQGLELDGQDMTRAWLADEQVARDTTMFWETKASTVASDLISAEDRATDPVTELNRYAALSEQLGRKYVQPGETQLPIRRPVETGARLFDTSRSKRDGLDENDEFDLALVETGSAARLEEEYRAWRARLGRIAHSFDSNASSAVCSAQRVTLSSKADVAVLEPADDFRFRDADFSFQTGVRLETLPDSRAVLAEHPGSWSLALVPTAIEGELELRLEALGKDPADPSHPGRPGATVRLSHTLRAAAGDTLHIAFTAFGWRFSETSLRLYVEGEPVAARIASEGAPLLPEVFASREQVRLGNSAMGDAGWVGELLAPAFYRMCLTPEEVVRGRALAQSLAAESSRSSPSSKGPSTEVAPDPGASGSAPASRSPVVWGIVVSALLVLAALGWAWRIHRRDQA